MFEAIQKRKTTNRRKVTTWKKIISLIFAFEHVITISL